MEFNIIAVIVAIATNFILGFVWYTPLFGKKWASEMGHDPNMKPDKNTMIKGMTFMVIGNILFVFVLSWTMIAWWHLPNVKEVGPLIHALNSAFFLWLGFYVPTHLSAIAWEKKSWTLFAINGGYHLASLLVVALILTYWP
ncbi:MAG: DUF1761 domain-containing protein [Bacteroidia bacterium]